MARVVLHRPLWLGSASRGDSEARRNSYTTYGHRQYWWSPQNSPDDEAEPTIDQANDPVPQEVSPLGQYRRVQHSITKVPRRIYILGPGNIGGFVAHSLASLPHPPPIQLLFYTQKQLTDWYEQGQSIKLRTHGLVDTKLGFGVESIGRPAATTASSSKDDLQPPPSNSHEEPIIFNLIVAVKAYSTVDALKRVAHRLRPVSSILFISNGMGIIEEVNKRVFPDPAKRPQYLLGVISHGVYTANPFDIIHAGAGTIAIAVIPHDIKQIKPTFESSALYLLRTLTRSPVLSAVGFPPTDLLQLQLEKLVVNAIINPLTAIYGCRNGDLLCQPAISRVMRLLLAEISLVIKSLPELQGVPNLNMRFDTRRLEAEVVGIATKTAANKSSMLQDIKRGRKTTEIEHITGYIVRRGEEVGIQCIMNYMIMQMVIAKQRMREKSRTNLLPVEENDTD